MPGVNVLLHGWIHANAWCQRTAAWLDPCHCLVSTYCCMVGSMPMPGVNVQLVGSMPMPGVNVLLHGWIHAIAWCQRTAAWLDPCQCLVSTYCWLDPCQCLVSTYCCMVGSMPLPHVHVYCWLDPLPAWCPCTRNNKHNSSLVVLTQTIHVHACGIHRCMYTVSMAMIVCILFMWIYICDLGGLKVIYKIYACKNLDQALVQWQNMAVCKLNVRTQKLLKSKLHGTIGVYTAAWY